jgi:hypothetical protein
MDARGCTTMDAGPAVDLSGGWARGQHAANASGHLGSYVRPDGSLVYLYARGARGQLFDATGERVGPEQRHWSGAVAYCHADGWDSMAMLSAGIVRQADDR